MNQQDGVESAYQKYGRSTMNFFLFRLSFKRRLVLFLSFTVFTILAITFYAIVFKIFFLFIFSLVPVIFAGWLFNRLSVIITTFFFFICYLLVYCIFAPLFVLADFIPYVFLYLFFLITGIGIHKMVGLCKFLNGELNHKKDTEDQLAEEKNWLRIILLSIRDCIITTDAKYDITFMNYEAEKLTGWTLDEVKNRKLIEVYKIFNEQTREEVTDPISRIMQRGYTIGLANHTILISKSGKEFPIGDSGAPIKDTTGKILGFIIIFRDVSRKKEMEEDLKKAQAQVIHSEKLAGIGQLAAGVAHEINNPLGYINSNLETLSTYVKNLKYMIQIYQNVIDNREVKAAEKELRIDYILNDIDALLADNKEGIEKIADIVRNLKDFACVSSQQEWEIVKLNTIIDNVLQVANNEIKYTAEIVREYTDDVSGYCNVSEMNQVFLNLILNAVSAIKEKFSSTLGKIIISTGIEQGFVFCRIHDNGCGISPEKISRIFEPFFTTKAPGEGTGLGLYIVYDIIVKKHKGEISVRSEEGQGTVFAIKLPLIDRQ